MTRADFIAPQPISTAQLAAQRATPTLDDVVERIAAEVSAPLTAALARVHTLASSGRIDRPSLRALQDEIDGARRVGLLGQQIARFARGQIQQSIERLDLTALLTQVLAEPSRRMPSWSDDEPRSFASAEVIGDASLVYALLQATVDWSAALARSKVEWRMDMLSWPVQAQISCQFFHQPIDLAGPGGKPAVATHVAQLDSLDWLLLRYTAHMTGVFACREDDANHTTLTLKFLHTVNDTLEGVSAVDLGAVGSNASLVAGSQVLVLAARRDMRLRVREAMSGHEICIDYVPSVVEAQHYCDDGAPDVLIYESSFDSTALQALRAQLEKRAPGMAQIEILPAGNGCDMGGQADSTAARVGVDGLRQWLLSLAVLELARRR